MIYPQSFAISLPCEIVILIPGSRQTIHMFYTCQLCPTVTLGLQPIRLFGPSMGFFRQEYWSGLPIPPQRDLPNSGIKAASPVSPALYRWILDLLSHQGSPCIYIYICVCVCVCVCVCIHKNLYLLYIMYYIYIDMSTISHVYLQNVLKKSTTNL